jgi:hypothetical protein
VVRQEAELALHEAARVARDVALGRINRELVVDGGEADAGQARAGVAPRDVSRVRVAAGRAPACDSLAPSRLGAACTAVVGDTATDPSRTAGFVMSAGFQGALACRTQPKDSCTQAQVRL